MKKEKTIEKSQLNNDSPLKLPFITSSTFKGTPRVKHLEKSHGSQQKLKL